jgi:hypothetical protein
VKNRVKTQTRKFEFAGNYWTQVFYVFMLCSLIILIKIDARINPSNYSGDQT